MAFRGWPAEALEFYEGLEADNSKAYWTAHKAVYEQSVYAPMTELLAELAPEHGAGKIFRLDRYRRAVADDKTGAELAGLIERLRRLPHRHPAGQRLAGRPRRGVVPAGSGALSPASPLSPRDDFVP